MTRIDTNPPRMKNADQLIADAELAERVHELTNKIRRERRQHRNEAKRLKLGAWRAFTAVERKWDAAYKELETEYTQFAEEATANATEMLEAWRTEKNRAKAVQLVNDQLVQERDEAAGELYDANVIKHYLEGRLETVLRGAGAADNYYAGTARIHNERICKLEETAQRIDAQVADLEDEVFAPSCPECGAPGERVEELVQIDTEQLARDLGLDIDVDEDAA